MSRQGHELGGTEMNKQHYDVRGFLSLFAPSRGSTAELPLAKMQSGTLGEMDRHPGEGRGPALPKYQRLLSGYRPTPV